MRLQPNHQDGASAGVCLLLFAAVWAAAAADAQTIGLADWLVRAGGTGGDRATDLAALPNGGAVLTGYFSGVSVFDTRSLTSAGASDIFVASYVDSGTPAWVARAGGTASDWGNGIAALPDGGALVTGYFMRTAGFGTIALAAEGPASGLIADVFVARYTAHGGVAWATRAGGPGTDWGNGIVALPDGGAYATGFFSGTAGFGAHALIAPSAAPDIFLARYAAGGQVRWATRAGGVGSDVGQRVALRNGNGAVVTGRFQSSADFGPITLTAAGADDVFVAAYAADGTIDWATRAGGADSDWGNAVAIADNGDIFVAGYFTGAAVFGATTLISESFSADIFLARYSDDGRLLWVKQAGGAGADACNGLDALSDGGVLLTGYFEGVAEFDTHTLSAPGRGAEVFVARYDARGTAQWAMQGGSAGADSGTAVAFTARGALAAGAFTGTARFEPLTVAAAGGEDMFLVRLARLLPTATPTRTATYTPTPTRTPTPCLGGGCILGRRTLATSWYGVASSGIEVGIELFRRDLECAADAVVVEDEVDIAVTSGCSWRVEAISDGGVWDATHAKVKWGPFFERHERTLRYTLIPPPCACLRAPISFQGQTSSDGQCRSIFGDALIRCPAPPHPADANGDLAISIGDVTGFAAAWKRGEHDCLNLVSQAGALWKQCESYRVVGQATAGVCLLTANYAPACGGVGPTATPTSRCPSPAPDATATATPRYPQGVGGVLPQSGAPWWVRLVAVGDTCGQTARCLIDGRVVAARNDPDGAVFDTFPGATSPTAGLTYPAGTALRVALSDGACPHPRSEIMIWSAAAPVATPFPLLVRDASGELCAGRPSTRNTAPRAAPRSLPAGATARRSLPDCFPLDIGAEVRIVVEAAAAAPLALAVEETLPAHAEAVFISDGGQWDTVNNKIKWGPWFERFDRELRYVIIARSAASPPLFDGAVSLDGAVSAIEGPRVGAHCGFATATPTASPPPADTPAISSPTPTEPPAGPPLARHPELDVDGDGVIGPGDLMRLIGDWHRSVR